MRPKTFRCKYGNRLRVHPDGAVQVVIMTERRESNSLAVWLSRGEMLALASRLRNLAGKRLDREVKHG